MKSKTNYRSPSEFAAADKEPTTPVSTRIRVSIKDALEKAANDEGKSLSWLLGRIIEDYGAWLTKKP